MNSEKNCSTKKTMTRPGFDQLITLYHAIRFERGSRGGELTVASSDQAELLRTILADFRRYGLALASGEPDEFAAGSTLRVRAEDPRIGLGLLADTFADVLQFPGGRIKEPRYFLLDLGYAHTDASPPEVVTRYRKVLDFIALLNECAAYLDKEAQELVFLVDGKFSLPLLYSADVLNDLDVTTLDTLLTRFAQDTHREQKLELLAKAVHETCSSASANERFARLLAELGALTKRFDDGYRLFAAEFSYEKIRDQLESSRLEEMAKIHKTFSDIQNQILSIPVATLVVATQLKPAQAWDAAFWVNTAILIGVWIFAVLTYFVLRNQLHTLDVIEKDIERKKAKVQADKYADVQDIVSNTFPLLDERLTTQRRAFRTVRWIVVVGLVLAHVMYALLTQPFRSYMDCLFGP